MSYALLKNIHMVCVALSYMLFFLRGLWLLRGSPIIQQRWVRFVPHTVDTVLLGSAIWLAVQLQISPLAAPWLMAKIIALLAYIGLGMIALHYGKTRAVQIAAWLAAQAAFIYIAGVALSKSVLSWAAL